MKKERRSFWSLAAVQAIVSSLLCIIIGLVIGFLVLLIINPGGAMNGIITILKNFMNYSNPKKSTQYLGSTLVKTAPLLMCALSIQFCYKAGLFNIGAAGQYVVGAGACLYSALAWHMPWYVCLVLAMAAGALWAFFVGVLKAYRNVNEVISGIMLNWIGLYLVNMLLNNVKESTSPYTLDVTKNASAALLPKMPWLSDYMMNKHLTIAVPLAVITAIVIQVVLSKTVFGYEVRATGLNMEAARYSGMKEKKNMILTLVIGGALAGAGAAFLYLSGYEQWSCTQSTVPGMGFNGIAATFLGGLNPIGTIFSSYFIQHITSGGAYLDKMIYPSQISDLISSIIIYLCAFVLFLKTCMNSLGSKKGGSKS